MKKNIFISFLIFLFVFLMSPITVNASSQKNYNELNYLCTDKENYFVVFDNSSNLFYVHFMNETGAVPFGMKYNDGVLTMNDYYGKTFSSSDMIEFASVDWYGYTTFPDTFNSNYKTITLLYSTKEIKYSDTNSVFMSQGYQSGVSTGGGSDSSTDDKEEDNSGFLSGIWNTIKDIFSSIKDGFLNIGNSISTLWINLKTSLSSWFSDLGQWFIDLLDGIKQAFVDFGTFIIDGLKSLFIPEEGSVKSAVDKLTSAVKNSFGISDIDFTSIVTDETELQDFYIDLHGQHMKVLNASYFNDAINKFRKYIQAFVALNLILFNINQVMSFTKQGDVGGDDKP